MAQLTGTLIGTLARQLAQDTSTTSPAVSDAIMLSLMNDVIMRFVGDVQQKVTLLPAVTSGLTFAANAAVKETTLSSVDWVDELLSAHPSDSTAANALLTPELEPLTVDQMLALHNDTGAGSVTGSGNEWEAWAWERVADNSGSVQYRVYVWPPLARQRYLTLRVTRNIILAALTDTPDLSQREARLVARLLAWEMARLHTRDEAFLGQILAPIPESVLNRFFQGGAKFAQGQGGIKRTGSLDG